MPQKAHLNGSKEGPHFPDFPILTSVGLTPGSQRQRGSHPHSQHKVQPKDLSKDHCPFYYKRRYGSLAQGHHSRERANRALVGILLSEVNKRGRPSKWPQECLPSKFADFECAFSL